MSFSPSFFVKFSADITGLNQFLFDLGKIGFCQCNINALLMDSDNGCRLKFPE